MNDPAYKRVLAHARIVKDLVTGCIAPLRPPGWADTLDLASLRPFPTENISDQLRRRLSDVVWQLDRRTGKGAPQTVNLVIEHQSRIDYAMPLRFLNYASLTYQRLYLDRKWRRGNTIDSVLHVVVYNGSARWDAALTLAAMTERMEPDGPAALGLSYDVVELVALDTDGLPRGNLLRWIAEIEQSARSRELPERVAELGEWLAKEDDAELTKSIDLWLAVLEEKWGVELPSIRKYEEVSVVLLEKIDHWEADIREQALEQGIERGIKQGIGQGIERGIKQGIEQGLLAGIRNVLEVRFGAVAAASVAAHLEAAAGDAPRLEQLQRAAVRAPDLESFRRVAENED